MTADLIDTPGVYDLPVDVYHRDPVAGGSLSSSGARAMLPPSCPARYRWELDNPGTGSTRAFDLGTAAHRLVLGAGEPIHVVDAPDWRTKAARAEADDARAAGAVPLLAHDYAVVEAMATALRRPTVPTPSHSGSCGRGPNSTPPARDRPRRNASRSWRPTPPRCVATSSRLLADQTQAGPTVYGEV